MKALQKDDDSLRHCFEKVGKMMIAGGHEDEYYLHDGILYRKHKVSGGKILDQLVVPKDLRVNVMKLAHEGIHACHQGVKRTVDRIVSEYYWPGVQSETKRFVKSCDVCQRTVPCHLVAPAPLRTMTVNDTTQRESYATTGAVTAACTKGSRLEQTLFVTQGRLFEKSRSSYFTRTRRKLAPGVLR